MGDRPRSSIETPRLLAGIALLAAVVCSWFYFASLIDCPNATDYCDGDDTRGPGLGMFYVTMLLGPLGYAAVLSAFPPSTTPPVGKNWLLWLVALISTGASALLNLAILGFVTYVGFVDLGSLGGFSLGLSALSLTGCAANGFAAALILRLLLPHRLHRRAPPRAAVPASPSENRLYIRFALGAGVALLIATATLGGFGFFSALLVIGIAFLLLPGAGSGPT